MTDLSIDRRRTILEASLAACGEAWLPCRMLQSHGGREPARLRAAALATFEQVRAIVRATGAHCEGVGSGPDTVTDVPGAQAVLGQVGGAAELLFSRLLDLWQAICAVNLTRAHISEDVRLEDAGIDRALDRLDLSTIGNDLSRELLYGRNAAEDWILSYIITVLETESPDALGPTEILGRIVALMRSRQDSRPLPELHQVRYRLTNHELLFERVDAGSTGKRGVYRLR